MIHLRDQSTNRFDMEQILYIRPGAAIPVIEMTWGPGYIDCICVSNTKGSL